MERKYVMQLPRGAKVSSTDIKCEDGKIILTAQIIKEEKYEPQDGDIVSWKDKDDGGNPAVSIYKEKSRSYATLYATDSMEYSTYATFAMNIIRPATKEEKQRLFDAMAKAGRRWNPEKKMVEDVRWRAKVKGYYYRIDSLIGETPDVSVCQDFRSHRNNRDYETGNYFKTKEAAVIAGNQMADVIKNSKAE